MKSTCKLCGKEITITKWHVRHSRGKYCSRACCSKDKSKRVKRRCKYCSKAFEALPGNVKKGYGFFCSHSCYSKDLIGKSTNNGKRNGQWKGGRRIVGGYVFIHNPYHPFPVETNYCLEHRLVAEKYLKRFLSPSEVIHHINEIKNDNRIENLYLFKDIGEHTSYHNSIRDKKEIEQITESNLLNCFT